MGSCQGKGSSTVPGSPRAKPVNTGITEPEEGEAGSLRVRRPEREEAPVRVSVRGVDDSDDETDDDSYEAQGIATTPVLLKLA